MVTKAKNRTESATPKSRINVGKLKLRKETIKDLTSDNKKGIKGGIAIGTLATRCCMDSCCSFRHSTCI